MPHYVTIATNLKATAAPLTASEQAARLIHRPDLAADAGAKEVMSTPTTH
jgi:hypothetical protein